MSNLEKASKAHEVHEELKNLRVSALWHFYRMGELVKEVRDNTYWEALGYHTFDSYLADPEISIPLSTAYHAIGVVETFPDYKEIEGLTVKSAISILSPIRQDEAKRERLIEMARSLSTSDLQHELASRKLIESRTVNPGMPKIYSCSECGKVKGVYWQDLCHCGMTAEEITEVSNLIKKYGS